MSKFEKRILARDLRKQGLSIGSIAQKLGVSKGSVSNWCESLRLTPEQKDLLIKNAVRAGQIGRLIGAQANKKKKADLIEHYRLVGQNDLRTLNSQAALVAGAALYWGEGSKSGKLAFTNSDPTMIKFMQQWFQKILKVKRNEFMPRLFINEMHRPRATKVLQFWSSLLNLPLEQFGNTTFIKAKQRKVYDNYESYFGVISLRVRRSAKLKYRILGLIEALRPEMPG